MGQFNQTLEETSSCPLAVIIIYLTTVKFFQSLYFLTICLDIAVILAPVSYKPYN